MLITIEISRPFQAMPGRFRAVFNNKINRRVWWLWFAVSWIDMDLKEYTDHIASGQTAWIK